MFEGRRDNTSQARPISALPSSCVTGKILQGARQLALKVKLSALTTGGTELAMLITEQVQDDFNKGTSQVTETPLRESALYEVFFRTVEQTLAAK